MVYSFFVFAAKAISRQKYQTYKTQNTGECSTKHHNTRYKGADAPAHKKLYTAVHREHYKATRVGGAFQAQPARAQTLKVSRVGERGQGAGMQPRNPDPSRDRERQQRRRPKALTREVAREAARRICAWHQGGSSWEVEVTQCCSWWGDECPCQRRCAKQAYSGRQDMRGASP